MSKSEQITICGETFEKKIRHFSFRTLYMEINDMEELSKLQQFPLLESVSLNGTNINDRGLYHLARCPTITNINLTFTPITDTGIGHLVALKNLEHLRLKDTDVSAESLPYFNQMNRLISLQVHETEIFAKEMSDLALPNLKELMIDCDDDEDFDALLVLSGRMPDCEILVKGRGTFFQGEFHSQ